MGHAVKVEGLAQLSRALRKLDTQTPKLLRVALNQSAEVIPRWAKPRIPRRSGRAAASVKAQSTRTAARVVGGGTRVPYYPWLDFGGRVGRHNSVSRPFQTRGRYIFEGFYRNRDEFTEVMETNLRSVVRAAGLELDHG